MAAALIPNEAPPVTEAPVWDFQRVVVACSATVVVRAGDTRSVTVLGDAALIHAVQVEQIEGALRIASGAAEDLAGVTVEVTAPELKSVVHRGAGRLEVHFPSAKRLELTSHGSGLLVATGNTNTLKATLKGAGDMHLQQLVATHGWLLNHGRGNLHAVIERSIRVDPVGPGSIKLNEHLRPIGRA